MNAIVSCGYFQRIDAESCLTQRRRDREVLTQRHRGAKMILEKRLEFALRG